MKEDSTRPLVCVVDDDVSVREFLTKPYDPADLLAAVKHATAPPAARVPGMASRNRRILGASEALRKMLHQVELVADTDATVLITGETGTGKELVARAIHEGSRRRRGPLVTVNCSAIPETLFEGELFGHVKGAFTGALRDRPGRFELAHSGTLVLDEIGEVPLAMQPKLLRALQEREVERVGETRPRKVDVRIVAVTNRELRAEVESGRFRADLYYRLNVFPIRNPSLRERREDIPLLARHFVAEAARRLGCAAPAVNDEALRQLADRDWPGNVRELENAVERAVILASGGPIRFEAADVDVVALEPPVLPAAPPPAVASRPLLTRAAIEQHQREAIAAALARTGGKVSGADGAAELLGMKPTTLYSRIAALRLRRTPA